MHLWLSERIFSWAHDSDGGQLSDQQRMKRPHIILAHAESLLTSGSSELSASDAVLNLKRAINSRLQHLEDLYRFSTLFPQIKGSLERLEQVGLARPFVVKRLFNIRNDIEHRDAQPPTRAQIRELVDATWYFLRTTDYACKRVARGLTLRSGDEGSFPPVQWISLRCSREKVDQFDVAGWVTLDFLSETAQPGFFECDLIRVNAKPVIAPSSDDFMDRMGYMHNLARAGDERFIDGKAALSPDSQREFWRLALDAL